jgi:hypothetical protein
MKSLMSLFSKGKAKGPTPPTPSTQDTSATHKNEVPDPGDTYLHGMTKVDDFKDLSDEDREALLAIKTQAALESAGDGAGEGEEQALTGTSGPSASGGGDLMGGLSEDEGLALAMQNSLAPQGSGEMARDDDGFESIPAETQAEMRQQAMQVGPIAPSMDSFGSGMNFDNEGYDAAMGQYQQDHDLFTNNPKAWKATFDEKPVAPSIPQGPQKDIFWQPGDPEPAEVGATKLPAMSASSGSIEMEAEEEQSWDGPTREEELLAGFTPRLGLMSQNALDVMSEADRARYKQHVDELTQAQKVQYLKSREKDFITEQRGSLDDLSDEERALVEQSRQAMDERDNRELASELPSRAARFGARDRYMLKAGRRGDAIGGLARSRASKAERTAQAAADARQKEATWAEEDAALPLEYPALSRADQDSEEEYEVPSIARGGGRGSDDYDDVYEREYIQNRQRAENRQAMSAGPEGLLDEPGGLLDEPGGLLDAPGGGGSHGGVIFDGQDNGLLDARPAPEGASGINRGLESARAAFAGRRRVGGASRAGTSSQGPGVLDAIEEDPQVENAIDDTPDRGRREREEVNRNRAADQNLMSETAAGIDDAYQRFKAGPGAFASSVVAPNVHSLPQEQEPARAARPAPRGAQAPAEDAGGRAAGSGWLGKLGSMLAAPFKALWRGAKGLGNALNPFNAERTQARQARARQQREADFDRRAAEQDRMMAERSAAADAEEERKEREIPGYKEQKEANARKYEEERLARTPDKQLSKEDFLKKKGVHSANTAEAQFHDYEFQDQFRIKNFGQYMNKKPGPRLGADGQIIESPAEESENSGRNPFAEQYEADKTNIEQDRMWKSDPKHQERWANNQAKADAAKASTRGKIGSAIRGVGLTSLGNMIQPPIPLMGSNSPNQMLAAYTDQDDAEAERLKAEAIKAHQESDAPSTTENTTENTKAAGSGGSIMGKMLNAVDSTRTNKPAALANVSDDVWLGLTKAERQKLVKDLATQDEADVEAGKSAGIINIDPKSVSTAQEIPAINIDPKSVSTAKEVSGGLSGTDAERRFEMQEVKNANRLAGAAEERRLEEQHAKNMPPKGWADALREKKSPWERDWDAAKEFVGISPKAEKSEGMGEWFKKLWNS